MLIKLCCKTKSETYNKKKLSYVIVFSNQILSVNRSFINFK